MQTLDFALIKERHPLADVLNARGIKLKKAGACLQGPCPIHKEDKGSSFTVWTDRNRWRCFGRCACGGDLFDLLAALDGGTPAEVARKLAGEVAPPKAKATRKTKERPPFDHWTHGAWAADACRRLADDEPLMQRLADRRGWRVEAVRQLAAEGSLGIADEWCGPVLVFAYELGTKVRGRHNGERRVWWRDGKAAGLCWRQTWLRPTHRTVIVCEGEPDAASLISARLEDPATIVLALANAGEVPDTEAFRGREIIVVPQADAAAKKHLPRLVAAFQAAGCTVRVSDLAPLLVSTEGTV